MLKNLTHGKKRNLSGDSHNVECVIMLIIVIIVISVLLCSCSSYKTEDKLFYAIDSFNLSAVREVVESKEKVNYENLHLKDHSAFSNKRDGRALALALTTADDEIVKLLIQSKKVNVNDSDYLRYSICNRSYDISELLLEKGCLPATGRDNPLAGYLSFCRPSREDYEKKIKLLLDYNVKIEQSVVDGLLKNEWRYLTAKQFLDYADKSNIDYDIPEALHAAITGDNQTLTGFCEEDITKISDDVILFAAANCSKETIEKLNNAGANLFIEDEFGLTPLHIAALCNTPQVVDYLLSIGFIGDEVVGFEDLTPITCALIGEKKENAELLLKKGYNFQETTKISEDEEILSTFISICSMGSAKSFKMMLELGYEIPDKEWYGAYINANDQVMRELLKLNHRCDVYEGDDNSEDKDYAVDMIQTKYVKEFVKRGAPVTEMVIYNTIESRNIELLSWLLDQATNDRTKLEKYALAEAIRFGDTEMVLMLLERNIDIKESFEYDFTKTTFLHIAAENCSEEIIRILIDNGADKTALNSDGLTPFECAKVLDLKQNMSLLKY